MITNASDETWWGGQRRGGWPIPYLAHLPLLDYSKAEVRLGLMTKAGREPSTVVVGFCREKETENTSPQSHAARGEIRGRSRFLGA